MLLTDAPSLRTPRSNPRSRSKPRSRPPRSIPRSSPRSMALPCLEEWTMWTPSSASPRSEGSGSESDKRDDVDGGDKWSTEPTGDVADSDICIPARRCTYKVFISTSYLIWRGKAVSIELDTHQNLKGFFVWSQRVPIRFTVQRCSPQINHHLVTHNRLA